MSDRRLQVTTPASDLALLTVAELRAAAGLTDTSQDVQLLAAGRRVAAKITAACRIAVGEGVSPTLRRERLTETYWDICARELILSRRHEIGIISATIDGVAVELDTLIVDPEAGLLTRRQGNCPGWWRGREVVVVYEAGFETVPEDLKAAAVEMLRWERSIASHDPFVKSVSTEVPGALVERTDLWVGSVPGQDGGPVPTTVAAMLRRFQN